MRSTTTTLIIAIVSVVLLTDSPHAQTTGGSKPAEQTPKADDKAYNAALMSLPDKKYDPWHAAR